MEQREIQLAADSLQQAAVSTRLRNLKKNTHHLIANWLLNLSRLESRSRSNNY
jgi:hypothetical protein